MGLPFLKVRSEHESFCNGGTNLEAVAMPSLDSPLANWNSPPAQGDFIDTSLQPHPGSCPLSNCKMME